MTTAFLDAINGFCTNHRFPKELQETFLGFCKYYEEAISPQEAPVKTFLTFLEAVVNQVKAPYQFPPYHSASFQPIDYYTLGLDFIRPLIDFSRSQVVGKQALQQIDEATKRNENVILFANHQTEVDPQIISLLIENDYPELAKKMIFVAGHRVVTDPLAVPLSLGRNLLCIYSKRHVDNPPEKKAEKLLHNQRALKVLEELLTEGGKCVYLAPSGGRDRTDEQGTFQVAPFDSQAIEMFYLLAQKAKTTTHFHTLALKTYPLLPPPDTVLVAIGETRKTAYAPAFLCFSSAINMEQIGNTASIQDKKEKRQVRCQAIWQQCATDYSKFLS